jgi:hypothetical protein
MPNRLSRVIAGVFVVGLAFDFLLYEVLLKNDLARDTVLRIMTEGPWPKLLLGELLFAIVFGWIYLRGVESRPALGQGLRFGFAIALLFALAGGLQIAPFIPTTETIIIGSIAGNFVKVLAQGMVGGLLAGTAPGQA